MSEFIGIWCLDDRPIDADELKLLGGGLEAMGTPRIWQRDCVGMVHRQNFFTPEDRLENQPIQNHSGQVFMADVRLNARAELVHALDLKSADQADGALMLHAIERWGMENAIKRLCGEFCFCLWSPSTQSLSLGRDPFGMRSLYVCRKDKLIAFSTSLNALLALPEVSSELDEQVLADFTIMNPSRPSRTLYRDIDRIPMGHFAVLTKDNTRLNRYWHQPQASTIKRSDPREYLDEAQQILDCAVFDAMRSIKPVCSFLTGGLDSTAVTLSAAKQSLPNKLTVLTQAPSGFIPQDTPAIYHDESLRAEKLTELYPNMDWHRIKADGAAWSDEDIKRYFLASGLPHRMHFNLAWFYPLYNAIAANGSNVCLTGDCGNNFFSYDGRSLLPELFLNLRWKKLFKHLKAFSGAENARVMKLFKSFVLSPFEPIWLRRKRLGKEFHWSKHSALNSDFAEELRLDVRLDWSKYRMRIGGGHPSTQIMRQWILEDEVSRDSIGIVRAMTGLDLRVPLIDKRVVEFFAALPLDVFIKGGVPRSITRELLAGKVPAQALQCRARGLQNGDWFARLSASRPAMLTNMARLKVSPLASRVIDLNQLQNLLDDWPANIQTAELRRRDYCSKLSKGYEMASFLAWHEKGKGV